MTRLPYLLCLALLLLTPLLPQLLLTGSARAAEAPTAHTGDMGHMAHPAPAASTGPMESSGARHTPPLPWADYAAHPVAPGRPGRDYTPVHATNGMVLPFEIRGDVKVYHLVCNAFDWELLPGVTIRTWGYNGHTPGPVIEAVAGDRVRIYVTNELPANTVVHWHGILLPNGQDGVMGYTQPPIKPGETYVYDFIFPDAGTFMYHSHFDGMTQEAMGMVGMIVVHPRGEPAEDRPDRDYVMMLQEWSVPIGRGAPNTLEMTDFNVLTINGKAFPATDPLVASLGETVRMRFGNLSPMDHHPIHLHGYNFRIVATDGGPIPEEGQWPETTVLVPVGSTRDVQFLADNPGDWLMHCHMTHHMMNQMGHGGTNSVGVQVDPELEARMRELLPGYMTMGVTGMQSMQAMGMPMPENSAPMYGGVGQFGQTVMGGMATVVKVRDHVDGFADPGWYAMPQGSRTHPATAEEMRRDGITTQ